MTKPVKQDRDIFDLELLREAWLGDSDKVKYALNRGANINAQNDKGMTALMQAADRGFVDIIELLVKKGADMFMTNEDGRTALDLATRKHRQGARDFLLQKIEEHHQKQLQKAEENRKRLEHMKKGSPIPKNMLASPKLKITKVPKPKQ